MSPSSSSNRRSGSGARGALAMPNGPQDMAKIEPKTDVAGLIKMKETSRRTSPRLANKRKSRQDQYDQNTIMTTSSLSKRWRRKQESMCKAFKSKANDESRAGEDATCIEQRRKSPRLLKKRHDADASMPSVPPSLAREEMLKYFNMEASTLTSSDHVKDVTKNLCSVANCLKRKNSVVSQDRFMTGGETSSNARERPRSNATSSRSVRRSSFLGGTNKKVASQKAQGNSDIPSSPSSPKMKLLPRSKRDSKQSQLKEHDDRHGSIKDIGTPDLKTSEVMFSSMEASPSISSSLGVLDHPISPTMHILSITSDIEDKNWVYNVGNFVHHRSHGNRDHDLSISDSKRNMKKASLWSSSDFRIDQLLGRGKFGMVYSAHDKTNNAFALKVLNKRKVSARKVDMQLLSREVMIQSRLNHTNILRMHGYFHDFEAVYLVLEASQHGDLYRYAMSKPNNPADTIPLQTAASYIAQVASALAYLQRNFISHRDIKPENLLLCGPNKDRIKLCDFGWAIHAPPPHHNMRLTLCGTPEYVPPEMLSVEVTNNDNNEGPESLCSNLGTTRRPDKKKHVRSRLYDARYVDLWELGVLAYEMVTGQTPFFVSPKEQKGAVNDQIFDKIRLYKESDLKPVSDYIEGGSSLEYKHFDDFVQGLMRIDPTKRSAINDVLAHPWIAEFERTMQP